MTFTSVSLYTWLIRSNESFMLTLFRTPVSETEQVELLLTSPCFISDLHLDTSSQGDQKAFAHFLSNIAHRYEELVILGDFFDYWVGDDAVETAQDFISLIKEFSQQHKVYFMHGNRDFMLGQRFANACHAHLISDPTIATIQERKYLLSHGDLWCTKDIDYQKVRARVRNPWWQWLILRLPLSKRLEIARNARNKSKTQKNNKSVAVMDVVAESILASCPIDLDGVIHGHTHRPGSYPIDRKLSRWVIPDWRHSDQGQIDAGFIAFDNNTPTINSLKIPLSEDICV